MKRTTTSLIAQMACLQAQADHQRQQTELARAEAKALTQEQIDAMDDTADYLGDYLEKLPQTHIDRAQALTAGVVQARIGGHHD